TNEFVQINGVATAGWACSPNGLVGRDASGGILSCQSGVWTGAGKINIQGCGWYSSPVAMDHFIGGRSGG
ncbi:shufflon system plasmid conjugative transfer pilus tip adhesin PilV, partial [Escherichia coli]|nr:shufflon system plasmid conjugative transfer pilus tip adhesin PilV [Escherichia coli]